MRAMWSGFLSFGLINIPTKLYSGTEDHSLHFELLHDKDHSSIRYARICTEEDKEVPWEEIVKGYETEEGDYIILTKEDFDAAKIEYENTVEIISFVDPIEITPFFYEKPYYLEPGKGGNKAYTLLLEALNQSKKVGIVRFFLHGREHFGALIPTEDVLVVNQMRMLEDIRDYSSLNLSKVKVTQKEIEMAVELVDKLSAPFDPESFEDIYKEKLLEIIRDKSKGKKVKIQKGKKKESTKVVDLMGMLKKSLEGEKKKRKSA